MRRKEEKVENILKTIPDPELGISLWDLGLIYDIKIKDKPAASPAGKQAGEHVKIVMTLTTIGCPLFGTIAKEIKEKVRKLEGIEEVEVELTFEPVWGPQMLSEEAKESLGF